MGRSKPKRADRPRPQNIHRSNWTNLSSSRRKVNLPTRVVSPKFQISRNRRSRMVSRKRQFSWYCREQTNASFRRWISRQVRPSSFAILINLTLFKAFWKLQSRRKLFGFGEGANESETLPRFTDRQSVPNRTAQVWKFGQNDRKLQTQSNLLRGRRETFPDQVLS